ncbi:MAG: helix-turn-helix domain-containing protein [Bacteroidota bacterium]
MIVDNKQQAFLVDEQLFHCGTSIGLRYLGGKWKSIILWYLRHGTLRFSEIKRLLPDMTDKMLSIQLANLEKDTLILRKQYGTKAPFKVEYSLTERGESLLPIIKMITDWGVKHAQNHGRLVELDH